MATPLPVTQVQILWVSMITAVTLGLALAYDPAEAGIMTRPPRPPSKPILSRYLIWRVLFVSIALLFGIYGLFEWERATGAALDAALTVAVNALVAGENAYLFNCRGIAEGSWTRDGLLGSRAVLIALALVIGLQLPFKYLPVMQNLFLSVPIDVEAWGRIVLFAVCLFVLVELKKTATRGYRLFAST